MYRKGLVDEAMGLSYHPEAEMMDEVRALLTAHGAPDISPAMTAFSEMMEQGATPDEVDQAMHAVSDAVAMAAGFAPDDARQRLDALVVLLRAAASEYAESTEGGVVGDITPYHEAFGFVAVATSLAEALAMDADPKVAAAGAKAAAALTAADEGFGDLATGEPVARDPAILVAVAARVEPVTRGERLAVVGWEQGLIRQPDQRNILFDLDQAIEAVQATDGKTAVFDTWTRTQSNLLRMWLEP